MPEERIEGGNNPQQSPDLDTLQKEVDESMASLAFATTISEQFMPQEEESEEESPEEEKPEESPEETPEEVEEEPEEDTRIEDLGEDINKRFDDLESKIDEGDKKGIQKLIETVKNAIK